MGAYEDQCAPANPRMPMIEDMKDLMTAAYYGTSLEDVRARRSEQRRDRPGPLPRVVAARPDAPPAHAAGGASAVSGGRVAAPTGRLWDPDPAPRPTHRRTPHAQPDPPSTRPRSALPSSPPLLALGLAACSDADIDDAAQQAKDAASQAQQRGRRPQGAGRRRQGRQADAAAQKIDDAQGAARRRSTTPRQATRPSPTRRPPSPTRRRRSTQAKADGDGRVAAGGRRRRGAGRRRPGRARRGEGERHRRRRRLPRRARAAARPRSATSWTPPAADACTARGDDRRRCPGRRSVACERVNSTLIGAGCCTWRGPVPILKVWPNDRRSGFCGDTTWSGGSSAAWASLALVVVAGLTAAAGLVG